MYEERNYRQSFGLDLEMHCLAVKETDLAICVPSGMWDDHLERRVIAVINHMREGLENYILSDPQFLCTHEPYTPRPFAPPIAMAMAAAAAKAGVGPMAAVAGAFSQVVGQLLEPICGEVVVENGGDIYLAGCKERLIGIFAGSSPFSDKVALKISGRQLPLGICTSSGTVGPSFSYGVADAAVILSADTLLADAVATGSANLVQSKADVAKAVEFAMGIVGITGALVIKDDAIAAAGAVELAPKG
jgi:ApbE superfamily uncharacterized protein (UPF0280 family)